jgi:uncharacterized glyoxalase superfamily protein PhnB
MATRKKAAARGKTAAKRPSPARKPTRGGAESKGLTLKSVGPSFTAGDLQKSMAWYRDVLGFTVSERWEGDGKLMGVEMSAGPVTFMLSQDDWKKGRDRVKGEGFRLFCDTTQDVDRLADQIKARGGTLAHEPMDEPWGARSITVEDPDGFKISIFGKKRVAK